MNNISYSGAGKVNRELPYGLDFQNPRPILVFNDILHLLYFILNLQFDLIIHSSCFLACGQVENDGS